jgi:hypothetical protein
MAKATSAKPELERGRAVTLFCVGCEEGISILPPKIPKALERTFPMLLATQGVRMKGRTIDGDTDAPTMFGLNGRELTDLLQPKCYSCAHADPKYRAELAHATLRIAGPDDSLTDETSHQ